MSEVAIGHPEGYEDTYSSDRQNGTVLKRRTSIISPQHPSLGKLTGIVLHHESQRARNLSLSNIFVLGIRQGAYRFAQHKPLERPQGRSSDSGQPLT